MDGKEFEAKHVYTRSIAAASSLVAIGVKLRQPMPVTVTQGAGGARDDVVFWFEPHEVEVAGMRKPALEWLRLLTCGWDQFPLSTEHPVAFLKASQENRTVLLAGVKQAAGKPFRVVKRGNRTIVIGADVPESQQRRLIEGS